MNARRDYYNDNIVSFFEPDNHKDLARAVIELYKNPKKRQDLVQNAKTFTSEYNWNTHKNVYLNIITSLTKNA